MNSVCKGFSILFMRAYLLVLNKCKQVLLAPHCMCFCTWGHECCVARTGWNKVYCGVGEYWVMAKEILLWLIVCWSFIWLLLFGFTNNINLSAVSWYRPLLEIFGAFIVLSVFPVGWYRKCMLHIIKPADQTRCFHIIHWKERQNCGGNLSFICWTW